MVTGSIATAGTTRRSVFGTLATLAARGLARERTTAGPVAATTRGRCAGRPRVMRAVDLAAAQNRMLELAVRDAPLEETLEAIVATVEGLSSTGVLASILLLDEDGMHLRHGAAPSLPAAYREAIDGIEAGPEAGSCGTAVHTRAPVYVADIDTDPLWANFRDLALSHGLRACWSIPITAAGGEVLGTFALYEREPRGPNPADLDLVDFVVRSTALVIERKRAQDGFRASEARLQFLNELGETLSASRDAPAAMSAAATLLARRLGASRTAYADVDVDNDRFVIRDDYTAPGVASSAGTYSLDLFGPRAAADMRQGRTLVIRDMSAELDLGEGREMFLSIGIGAIVCCPLVRDGRLVAMMAVHQDRGREWLGHEVALVKTVVERCWAHVERVGAEARLRVSEERLRLATEAAEVGFWDVDVANDVLIWPPRVKAMFGISPDVAVSMRDYHDGLHPDDREATREAYAAAADPARRALYDVEYRAVGREDGLVRWVAAKGRGVFDAGGRCVRVVGTAVEVTSRKRIEERLRELNETLERRVEEEVAERAKAEDALRQAQKMEAVGQLTGGIAHDFNNMLAVVIGSLDLLGRRLGTGDARAKRYVDAATDGARRAALLTQRLLAFSRQQPLRPEPVDANKLVVGLSDLMRGSLGSDVRLETVLAPGLWRTHADPNQLENVLLNLAVNARDAMPEGGRLTVETANAVLDARYVAAHLGPQAGQYVLVAVTDTGSGMPEEVIAKAFDPFFTTKEVGKGTGLGLSQVYGFARQSGGHVKIYSEPGQGTTVKVYLPRHVGADADPPAVEAARDRPLGGGREVVLVVEDEPAVRQFSVDALTELGYRVLDADGAAGALRLLDARPEVALMFTDIAMPEVNGAKLAREARRMRPDLRVLFTTGYARDAAVHGGVPDAEVELIGKPFTVEELAAKVREVLDGPPKRGR